jgi:hypothetical protein
MVELIARIVVHLSDQKLYAYDGQQQLVQTMLVSTGKPSSPTGSGKVLSKHPSITMRGRAQPTGKSPGWPKRGSPGISSKGGRGPVSGKGSPCSAAWASSQFTAVARRVRRG